MIRRDALHTLLLGALACSVFRARPQSYPSRPTTLLVGGAPGSVPDIMIRPIAQRLAAALGQPVVVENRPGAAGSVAMSALLQSARGRPDAGIGDDVTGGVQPLPVREAAVRPAARPGTDRAARHRRHGAGRASLVAGAGTLGEFVTLAKAQPGKYFVAIPQSGSPPHIVALLLNRAAGIEVTMVPHKSGADAVNAVVSGEIALLFDAPTIISSQVRAGKLKALAVTGRQRDPALPDTPTANEAGFDVQGEAWIGLVAPRGTPAAVVQRLNREIGVILATSEMSAMMARLSFRTLISTPEAFRELIRDEHTKWSAVIREAGLRLE